jgi:hypothetical protein
MDGTDGWIKANNSLSLLALADPFYRSDCAAPFPRQISPRVGSSADCLLDTGAVSDAGGSIGGAQV